MRVYALIVILFVLGLFTQCSLKKESTVDAPKQVQVVKYSFERFSPSCQGDSTDCASFRVNYPILKEYEHSPAQDRINEAIRNEAKQALGVGEPDQDVAAISLEEMSMQFFSDYQQMKQETDIRPMAWAVEVDGKLIYQSDEIITVAMNSYQFTGGAHPNMHTALLNFDRQTGEQLEWPDILIDSTAFIHLAEQQFRKARQIGSNMALDKAGFFWGGSFHPPANFSLQENGLRLFYNNYEIAPYALGPTDFTINYSHLGDVVKPRFIEQTEQEQE